MYKEEIALRFSYPYELIDKSKELVKILNSKKIKFCFYESNGYWNHEFVVRRSGGYTWNEIIKIINSVHASQYKKIKTRFNDNGEEVVICN